MTKESMQMLHQFLKKALHSNLSHEEVQQQLPPYKIQSEEGWLIERSIINQDGEKMEQSTQVRFDDEPFVQLVKQQRRRMVHSPKSIAWSCTKHD